MFHAVVLQAAPEGPARTARGGRAAVKMWHALSLAVIGAGALALFVHRAHAPMAAPLEPVPTQPRAHRQNPPRRTSVSFAKRAPECVAAEIFRSVAPAVSASSSIDEFRREAPRAQAVTSIEAIVADALRIRALDSRAVVMGDAACALSDLGQAAAARKAAERARLLASQSQNDLESVHASERAAEALARSGLDKRALAWAGNDGRRLVAAAVGFARNGEGGRGSDALVRARSALATHQPAGYEVVRALVWLDKLPEARSVVDSAKPDLHGVLAMALVQAEARSGRLARPDLAHALQAAQKSRHWSDSISMQVEVARLEQRAGDKHGAASLRSRILDSIQHHSKDFGASGALASLAGLAANAGDYAGATKLIQLTRKASLGDVVAAPMAEIYVATARGDFIHALDPPWKESSVAAGLQYATVLARYWKSNKRDPEFEALFIYRACFH